MKVSGLESDIRALKKRLDEAGFDTSTSELILNSEISLQEAVYMLTAVGGSMAGLVKAIAAYLKARKKKLFLIEPDRTLEAEFDDPEELREIIEASREGSKVSIRNSSRGRERGED